MDSSSWTTLSGVIVAISGLYYAYMVWTKKAPANFVSWIAWSVIGIAIYLTSNIAFGINAITFAMVNPVLVTFLAMWRQFKERAVLETSDKVAGTLGLLAIILWLTAQRMSFPSGWILGLSIVADCIPMLLIVKFSWTNPMGDRPFPWLLFGFGFGISVLGLSEYTIYTLAVPVYMFIGANVVALPLAYHRIQNRMALREWF